MATTYTAQNVPGGGAPFAMDNAVIDGGRPQIVKLVFGEDGTASFVNEATGLPVIAAFCDPTDQVVKPGNLTLQALRTEVVGGATVTEASISNAPYAVGIDLGIPSLFLIDETGSEPLGIQGAANIARMSKYGLIYVTAPPRNSSVQNNVTLITTAETPLLTAGAAGVFHDLSMISVYTDDPTPPTGVSRKVLFRDTTNGTVRFTIPLGEKSGSGPTLGSMRWKQTTAASTWTVALSTACPIVGSPPEQSSVFVHVIAEKRLD